MRVWRGLLACGWFMCVGLADGQFDLIDSQSLKAGKPSEPKGATKVDQRYLLTDKQGPVMVKVVSFLDEYMVKNTCIGRGSTLANELAKELRETHKIDAYVYKYLPLEEEMKSQKEYVEWFEEKYKVRPKVFKLKNPPLANWVVFAGSFESFEDSRAQKLRERVRGLDPKAIPNDIRLQIKFNLDQEMVAKTQAAGDRLPKVPRVLGSASLSRNPLTPASQSRPVIEPAVAKMLIELNQDEPHSIYNNKSTYTISVYRFVGFNKIGSENKAKELFSSKKSGLEIAGQNAIILTDAMRKSGYDAYVFHGQDGSMVCVGGYSGMDDPRIESDFKKLQQTKIGELALDPRVVITPKHPGAFLKAN